MKHEKQENETANDSGKGDEIQWKEARLAEQSNSWSRVPYGYQWPASRLSRNEMAKLTVVSNHIGRPLNQLIKEAVDSYADKLIVELGLATKSKVGIIE